MNRPAHPGHVARGQSRLDVAEDVADLLEQHPTMTLEGLAVRLGRSRDSITMALRRAARDGDPVAIAARARLADSPRWKDVSA